ncbi:Nucleotide-binding, alpha-beta plait [Artemisia annua]|uniref:Nucleotide-binding, alpha-beta plait n=1 Tax=Artemisia annua TaxID=35608 RepID=A0A2U1NG52_ARTAN|nr:Nucleotide-binding, alpha-beta plait [Artemisia annua]
MAVAARAFRVGSKPDFVLGGTLHPSIKWAEEDNEVDPDELAKDKEGISQPQRLILREAIEDGGHLLITKSKGDDKILEI